MTRTVTLEAPGLYFAAGEVPDHLPLERTGAFHAGGSGLMFDRAADARATILFDGLLLDGSGEGTDAERALAAYGEGGIDSLCRLDGYYNAIVIPASGREAWLVSDIASSRPWYVYEAGPALAAAPTPVFFSDLGLPMTLDRQGLYETVRLLHPGGRRTLVREVQRVYPGVRLRVDESGGFIRERHHEWIYRPDVSRTLDAMAEEIRDLVSAAVAGVLRHPRLERRPVELSLTGGMDSRHILGELLAQGRPPSRIRHVHVTDAELEPVRRICESLDLDLDVRPIDALDVDGLTRRWAIRSGGLVNHHQFYLLDMMQDLPPGGVVGFDGYLMDWFLGLYPKKDPMSFERPEDPVWDRRHPMHVTLHALFGDAAALSRRGRDEARLEAAGYDGPPWFRFMMLDFHRRGLHYTGVPYTMMADDALYFAPGASRRALMFFLSSEYETAGEKRARLRSMQRHFPELASFPDPSGVPYTEYTSLRKRPPSLGSYLSTWPRALVTGLASDPAPQTVHQRLRTRGALRSMHERALRGSALIEDGHLRGAGVRFAWRAHQLGAYEGWTLASLLTAEVAYRILVRGEGVESVLGRLLGCPAGTGGLDSPSDG